MQQARLQTDKERTHKELEKEADENKQEKSRSLPSALGETE